MTGVQTCALPISPGVVLHYRSQALYANVLQIVRVASNESADGGGRSIKQNRVGINRGHCYHHLIHCIALRITVDFTNIGVDYQ